jgi:tetratricopeptide (TPR) repeat protein
VKILLRIFWLIFFISYQLLAPDSGLGTGLYAQVPQSTNQHEKISLAQKQYFEGNFDLAINLIKACLQEGIIADNEKVRAYKILAQAYLAKDFEQPAREVIKKLLEIVPEYNPSIEEDPPQFIELVKKVKKENTVKKTEQPKAINDNRNHWLWVGSAGVVILGATAILMLNGPKSRTGEQAKPLSPPPPWPE